MLLANSRKEVLARTVHLLTRNAVKVTFRGHTPYVSADPRTGKVLSLNLPEITDDASPMLIDALQGYVDHECGHIFYTPFNRIPKHQMRSMLANVFEDIRLEKLLPRDLPGTRDNLERMHVNWIPLLILPGIRKQIDAKAPADVIMSTLIVPAMRAIGGQQAFVELMDGENLWPHIKPLMERLPGFSAEVAGMESYDDVLACVERLLKAMEKQMPKAPPPPPEMAPPQTPPQDDSDSSEGDKGDGAGTQADDPEDGGTSDDDNDEPEASDSGDDSDEEGEADSDDGDDGGDDAGDSKSDPDAAEPSDGDGADEAPDKGDADPGDDGETEGAGGPEPDGDDEDEGGDTDNREGAGNKAGSEPQDDDDADGDAAESDEADADGNRRDEGGDPNRKMMEALRHLDPTLRRALFLHKKRKQSMSQISQEMNVTESEVLGMLRSARRFVAEYIKG